MIIHITPIDVDSVYMKGMNLLFERGLHALHLRLPKGATIEQYKQLLLCVKPRYRSRLVLCDAYELCDLSMAGGIHLSGAKWKQLGNDNTFLQWLKERPHLRCSISAHSFDELHHLPFIPTYALLSPIFDSISKKGYKSNFTHKELKAQLQQVPFPVFALGGITPERMTEVRALGFAGGATLGYIGEANDEYAKLAAFERFDAPEVLTVAGHDPTTGAGFVADALHLHDCGIIPLTLPTTLTAQNEDRFVGKWSVPDETLHSTLCTLFERHHPKVAKIGMVASLEQLHQLVSLLRKNGVRTIIWDPIAAPSSSPTQQQWHPDDPLLQSILSKIDMVTPNRKECQLLFGGGKEALESAAERYNLTIVAKGMTESSNDPLLYDMMVTPNGYGAPLPVAKGGCDRHGTGCLFSSVFAARLAQCYTVQAALHDAQRAVQRYRHHQPIGRPIIKRPLPRLLFITNHEKSSDIIHSVEEALAGGCRWVQLRMKKASTQQRVDVANKLLTLMRPYGALLTINDDIEAALLSGADGVHLGLNDSSVLQARRVLGPEAIIGGTCNTVEHLLQRALEGVDYVGVGPYRLTTTKAKLSPLLGLDGLAQLSRASDALPHPLPLYAIGGITLDDIEPLAHAITIAGVAISGAIAHATQPQESTKMIIEQIKRFFK